ncbi:MAG TPA: aminopeptidase P family protein [Rhodospirillaceae bacterium]|nr:aminopeptidase P family protein [Rhodospirillaceae bacterium]
MIKGKNVLQTIPEKLVLLRADMKRHGIDCLLVPHNDEFGSEYCPPHAEHLMWITGFTGSAGAAAILQDRAMVMTDGRYTIQLKDQVDSSLFELCDMSALPMGEWVALQCPPQSVVGYDPQLYTKQQIDSLSDKIKEKHIILKALDENLIAKIWMDRPDSPVGLVELFPDDVAGASSRDKRQAIAQTLSDEKIDACVITVSDSICWLLNVRGSDIDFNPLVLSYAILHSDATVDWFVQPQKIPSALQSALSDEIRLHPIETFADAVRGLKAVIQYDPARSSIWVYNLLVAAGATIIMGKDPCILPKACKTEPEQLAIKQAHIRDGVALTRFLFWFEAQDLTDGHVTELLVEEKLEEFRRADRTYRGPSFSTIAGWADHGAIVHYHATPESNYVIGGDNFLLLDSGGQYEYGTTDVTRTIVAGDVTPEMKDRFTRVLKGHIALASARFTPETTGAALDNLARQPLIDEGLNFSHGTGHGVGCFLSVHEESTGISPRSQSPFRPGMLVSNEPGYYLEGAFGIRHENLILCHEDAQSGKYYFETITCVPFDLRGIDWTLMTDREKQWLDDYHQSVVDTLAPFLDEIELQWLRNTLFPEPQREETDEDVAFGYSAYD